MIAPALKEVLVCAYPCASLCGTCQNRVHYLPERGLIPRGYTGAFASLNDVQLVLCLAEPGTQTKEESYDVSGPPADLVDHIGSCVRSAYERRASSFHRNVRLVLNRCWPDLLFDEQLERTWITEGVLCSASATTAPVLPAVEEECSTRYLRRELELMPRA